MKKGGITIVLAGHDGANAGDPALSVSHAGIVLVYTSWEYQPDSPYWETVPVVIAQIVNTGGSLGTATEIARSELFLSPGGQMLHVSAVGSATVAEFGVGHVIAWSAEENYDPETLQSDTVHYVQAFTGYGPLSQPFAVAFPVLDIAATGNGNFIVVGIAQTEQTDGYDVVGQIFSGLSGSPIGDPFIVTTTTEGDQYAPSVTPLEGAAGGFVVVWADEPNGAVGAQVFDWLGQRRGDEFPVTFEAGGVELSPWEYSNPDVAADIYDGFMVTWTGWDTNGWGVRGQTYTPALAVSYGPFGPDPEIIDFGNLTDDLKAQIDFATANLISSIYRAGGGNDQVTLPDIAAAQITATVSWDFNQTFDAGSGDDVVWGGNGNDVIDGGSGNNTLRGGLGSDQLYGGAGNDFLSEDSGDYGPFGDDRYDGGEGNDRVSLFTAFGPGVKIDLRLTTAQNTGSMGTDTFVGIEHITSNYGNDRLTGNDAANWFWTFSGNDTLSGNGGNDYFTVGQGNKIADGGSGSDTIEVSDTAFQPAYTAAGITVSLALQGAVQATGIGNWTLTRMENLGGSWGADRLTGDASANILAGAEGSDTLLGGDGDDILAGDGTFDLDGNAAPEFLANPDWVGGDDILEGGNGNDTLIGGAGDDVFIVDDAGDIVSELTGEGADRVESRVNWTLSANVEQLTLAGTSSLSGTGNSSANTITGNSGDNSLLGLTGKDSLFGGAGADTLNGGTESDTLVGATGNDTYVVDSIDDVVAEAAAAGLDLVQSSVDWTLSANVEQLLLLDGVSSGTGNAQNNLLTGNALSNILTGLAGNDTLMGAGAPDTLIGGLGNDTYLANLGDQLIEVAGEGTDTVKSNIAWTLGAELENLSLGGPGNIGATGNDLGNLIRGNDGNNRLQGLGGADTLIGGLGADLLEGGLQNDNLTGGVGADRLVGGDGNDTLIGAEGNDTLTGGKGIDAFVFQSALSAATNLDTVMDFAAGVDKLRLDDDVFAAFTVGVALTGSQFVSGAGITAAQTIDQRIAYNTTTGALYYDADGLSGEAAVQFAVLGSTTHPALSVGDFVIVA